MKTNHWLIVVVLLLLTALGGMMELNTIIQRQQEQLAVLDRYAAEAYWTRIAALPKPYHLPLDQLWVSSGTGFRMDPLGGVDAEEKLHDGLDLAAPIGTPVYAALAGRVAEHWLPPDGGRWKGHPVLGGLITLEHGPELFTRYGHLSKTYVHEGDYVEAGQLIGEVGATGMATGPHLHWQVIVSPAKYLEEAR